MGITRCGETRGKKSDTASTDMESDTVFSGTSFGS